MKTLAKNASAEGNVTTESWLEMVRRQVGSLNFGVVQIIVHGARVVQIERTEKVRLEDPIVVTQSQD